MIISSIILDSMHNISLQNLWLFQKISSSYIHNPQLHFKSFQNMCKKLKQCSARWKITNNTAKLKLWKQQVSLQLYLKETKGGSLDEILWKTIQTIFVTILRSVSLKIRRKCYVMNELQSEWSVLCITSWKPLIVRVALKCLKEVSET